MAMARAVMLALDANAFRRLSDLKAVTRRPTSSIIRLLVAQAALAQGATLVPTDAHHTRHLLFRPGPLAGPLESLCVRAGCSRSALVRQLLTQCPVPALPNPSLPLVITVLRPQRPSCTRAGHPRPPRRRATPNYLYALLGAPGNDDTRARLAALASATGRSVGETLRLLVMQARLDPTPDIHLQDGPVIVRITRHLPNERINQ